LIIGPAAYDHGDLHLRSTVTASYTFDIVSTLDGFGSYNSDGDWGGYWGKQGPEFLDHRLAVYGQEQRLVLGANTFRQFVAMMGPATGQLKQLDPVNARMRHLPTTVVSTTLEGPLDWPDATLVDGAQELTYRPTVHG
jgi:hypothetical protein